VVDFYGPAELASLKSSEDPGSPEAILLGAAPVSRPDLAKIASPVTYVDPRDPPFLIIHGENDELVWNRQSKLLSAWLTVSDVENELVIVPGAPHFGVMFDADPIRSKVLSFLRKHL
jgi:dipeptidyl aminopeptidase/acylaminoacyl peptidase